MPNQRRFSVDTLYTTVTDTPSGSVVSLDLPQDSDSVRMVDAYDRPSTPESLDSIHDWDVSTPQGNTGVAAIDPAAIPIPSSESLPPSPSHTPNYPPHSFRQTPPRSPSHTPPRSPVHTPPRSPSHTPPRSPSHTTPPSRPPSHTPPSRSPSHTPNARPRSVRSVPSAEPEVGPHIPGYSGWPYIASAWSPISPSIVPLPLTPLSQIPDLTMPGSLRTGQTPSPPAESPLASKRGISPASSFSFPIPGAFSSDEDLRAAFWNNKNEFDDLHSNLEAYRRPPTPLPRKPLPTPPAGDSEFQALGEGGSGIPPEETESRVDGNDAADAQSVRPPLSEGEGPNGEDPWSQPLGSRVFSRSAPDLSRREPPDAGSEHAYSDMNATLYDFPAPDYLPKFPKSPSLQRSPSPETTPRSGTPLLHSTGIPPPLPPIYAATSEYDSRVDKLGEELAPESGVWKVYATSAAAHDAETIDGYNKSLDVLLIFASLFSAVVTAFVIEASKLLQPDYTQVNALLTAHVLSTLAGNTSLPASVPSSAQILSFHKTASSQAVNILWFAALGFSLGAVLVAMLAKQWLSAYMSFKKAEPYGYTCERQQKFDDAREWGLPQVMAFLPALLHVSLFLFLIGLIVYMWQLDPTVSIATCVILAILFVFYFGTGALAVFNSRCPYVSPISQSIRALFRISRNSTSIASNIVLTRALSWLAMTAKDPKTVSAALQSLAGLPRGFSGYIREDVESLAKLAFERLKECFIVEWRRGGSYVLRTETQYEASCYSRTLVNCIDHPSSGPDTFQGPLLATFLELLGKSSDPNIRLLALCDNQRLIHRAEVVPLLAIGDHPDNDSPRPEPDISRKDAAKENMDKILKVLADYAKEYFFLQPFALKTAVETMGYAPLPWVAAVSTPDAKQEPILLPLMRLQNATRGGSSEIRLAMARTWTIFAKVHEAAQQGGDTLSVFESSLAVISELGDMDDSADNVRERILLALSYFAGNYKQESASLTINAICDELYFEADRRAADVEDTGSGDGAAITALLTLLPNPTLAAGHKTEILTRVQAYAVSAAPGFNVQEGSILYRVTPRDPFSIKTVSILLETLSNFKETTESWLKDVTVLVLLVTREHTHKNTLLSRLPDIIKLIRDTASEEVAMYLFYILTDLGRQAVASVDSETVKLYASADTISLLFDFGAKHGLTPLDAQAWSEILPKVTEIAQYDKKEYAEKINVLCQALENQTAEELEQLQNLRQPLLQYLTVPPQVGELPAILSALRNSCHLPETSDRTIAAPSGHKLSLLKSTRSVLRTFHSRGTTAKSETSEESKIDEEPKPESTPPEMAETIPILPSGTILPLHN